MERNRRRPAPDVEEALSSMLWTPYERTPPDSSDDELPKPPSKRQPSPSARFSTRPTSFADPHATSSHLYPAPIRYLQRWSQHAIQLPFVHPANYRPTQPPRLHVPPSPSSLQLPSYEAVERERLHHGNGGSGEAGIYLITPSSGSNEGQPHRGKLVNSFTDDFAQYREVSFD